MKHTTKNFPEKRHYPKGTCFPWMEDILDWGEGFEKELRDYREKLKEDLKASGLPGIPCRLYLNAQINLITEILGESSELS